MRGRISRCPSYARFGNGVSNSGELVKQTISQQGKTSMSLRNEVPDKTLLKSVLQSMTRKGVNAHRVKATVQAGSVTIVGTIDYDHERRLITNSVSSITGVKRVIDQLRVEKKKRT